MWFKGAPHARGFTIDDFKVCRSGLASFSPRCLAEGRNMYWVQQKKDLSDEDWQFSRKIMEAVAASDLPDELKVRTLCALGINSQ